MMLSGLVLLAALSQALAISVVVFLPGTNRFDRVYLERIAQQLAMRNHQVTAFKAVLVPEQVVLVKPRLFGVRELTLKSTVGAEFYEPLKSGGNDIPWRPDYDTLEHAVPLWRAYTNSCEAILQSDALTRIAEAKPDVALVYAGNPCHLAIVQLLAVPFIYFDLSGISDETIFAAGLPLSVDTPSSQSTLSPPLNLAQRMNNYFLLLGEWLTTSGWDAAAGWASARHRHLDGPQTALWRGSDAVLERNLTQFASAAELKRRARLYFVNSDALLEFAGRALPANVFYVGGGHMEPPRPLLEPWNQSVSTAPHGSVLVSFGTVANASAMPDHMMRAFATAFTRLSKLRFFWRINTNEPPNITDFTTPPNVNFTQHIPQNDLLANKRTRLLITNGGVHSILEALAHGVPILGVPLYGANYNNLRKVEASGFGLILDKNNLTAASVYATVRQLLDNPKYVKAAQQLAEAFGSRREEPLAVALGWIEHVGRNRGAPALSRRRRATNPFSALLWDALLVFVGLPLIASALLHRWLKRRPHEHLEPVGATKTTPRARENSKRSDATVRRST